MKVGVTGIAWVYNIKRRLQQEPGFYQGLQDQVKIKYISQNKNNNKQKGYERNKKNTLKQRNYMNWC